MFTSGVHGDATVFALVWLFERPFHMRLDMNPCWTFVEDLDFCIPGAENQTRTYTLNLAVKCKQHRPNNSNNK